MALTLAKVDECHYVSHVFLLLFDLFSGGAMQRECLLRWSRDLRLCTQLNFDRFLDTLGPIVDAEI
jgi:hypothetical protein